jgi:hypothetical protein
MTTTSETIVDGKILALHANGKPVEKSYMRGLDKAQATRYWKLFKYSGTATNPYTRVEVELNPLEFSLYTWLMNWYTRYERGGVELAGAPIQAYDDVKYLLLKLNTQAYYDLID